LLPGSTAGQEAPERQGRCAIAFVRGNGGQALFGANTLKVITWQGSFRNRLAETTNSGTNGLATWFPTVSEGDGSMECLLDDTELPDTDFGMTRGASGTLRLDLGNSGKFYTGTALIEDLVMKVNNVQDVVKFDVRFKYSGTLTLPIT
jgi:hypothetical protein